MKKASILLALTILLIGGVIVALSSPSLAQGDPPPHGPFVGPKTPWTFFHGDWFKNGVLHYNYGPKPGWAPYYAHPPGPVERPGEWYGEKYVEVLPEKTVTSTRWIPWAGPGWPALRPPSFLSLFGQSFPY